MSLRRTSDRKARSALQFGRKKAPLSSPPSSSDVSPAVSPRPSQKDDELGVPKSKSLASILDEAKVQADAEQAASALKTDNWNPPPRLRKKQSLADIFFMSQPLHGAAKLGNLEEVKKMAQVRRLALNDADFLAWLNGGSNKNQQTPLHVAIQHGHLEVSKVLTRLGCRLNMQDVNGRSCVLYCGRFGSCELLRFFLRRVSLEDVAADRDLHGDGILHLAAACGHANIIEYLVGKKKLDVNVVNNFGETPLHKAARTDDEEMVRTLLSHGADINIIGRDGKPKHVTQSPEIVALLRTRKMSQSDSSPVTAASSPIHITAMRKASRKASMGVDSDSDHIGEDADSDDVFSKIRASTPVGESPRLEQTQHKLRRALQKSSQLELRFGEFPASDEILRTRHEHLRQSSSFQLTPRSRSSTLADPSPESGVVVETALARGSVLGSSRLTYQFQPYSSMYNQTHWNYICREFGTDAGPVTAILSVEAAPSGGKYHGLLRYSYGYEQYDVMESDVAEYVSKASCPVSEGVRLVLEREAVSADRCFVKMSDKAASMLQRSRSNTVGSSTASGGAGGPPKLQRDSLANTSAKSRASGIFASLRKVTVDDLWTAVTDTSLGMELLALELKLGLAKGLAVGVIRIKPGQSEAEAMQNPSSPAFESFLSLLGNPIETKGWSGYSGGLSTKNSAKIWYTSWKGVEIAFHSCPELTEDQRRQFIGNDKTVIYFLDEWTRSSVLEPKFRGNVNSVAITARMESLRNYHFQAFHRIGMEDVPPALPEEVVEFSSDLRQHLLTKIINAHVAAYNLLYADRMKRAWDEELSKLGTKYLPKKAAKKAGPK